MAVNHAFRLPSRPFGLPAVGDPGAVSSDAGAARQASHRTVAQELGESRTHEGIAEGQLVLRVARD